MSRPEDPTPTETNDQRVADPTPDPSDGAEPAAPTLRQTGAEEVPPAQAQPTRAPQAGAPEHSRGAEATQNRHRHPAGHSPGSSPPSGVPESAAAPNRYGRPMAQPFTSQPGSAAGQDFSSPTVRFAGRAQPEPGSSPARGTRVRPTRIPRRASLQLRHLEPWSVLKVSLVLSIAGFLAWMVAVGVLYSVLEGMGVWDQLNGTYSDLTSVSNQQGDGKLISAGGVFGVAAMVGLVNIVLITAMCSVGAFIYNASADLAGGIEVTLSERD